MRERSDGARGHACARATNLSIPKDVAVTGFDDVPVARHLHPPMTTVRQPMQELGGSAFEVLYSKITTGKGEADVVLPVQLIVRESCGCAAVRKEPEGEVVACRDDLASLAAGQESCRMPTVLPPASFTWAIWRPGPTLRTS